VSAGLTRIWNAGTPRPHRSRKEERVLRDGLALAPRVDATSADVAHSSLTESTSVGTSEPSPAHQAAAVAFPWPTAPGVQCAPPREPRGASRLPARAARGCPTSSVSLAEGSTAPAGSSPWRDSRLQQRERPASVVPPVRPRRAARDCSDDLAARAELDENDPNAAILLRIEPDRRTSFPASTRQREVPGPNFTEASAVRVAGPARNFTQIPITTNFNHSKRSPRLAA
jgi:hypothetical protein